jgi:hypothetical protein
MQMKRAVFGAVLATGLMAIAADAPAAVLVLDSAVRVDTLVTTPVNLTTQGSSDWAYWAPAAATALTPPVAPTDDKLGASIISGLNIVGGTSLRGSATAATTERYTWTDGTNPTTGTNASLAGLIFNSDLGTSASGKGLSLTITGDPAVSRTVNLYLGGFAATGNLLVTLNGATSITDTTQVFANSSPKQMVVYTLHFQPNSVSDLLSVQWTASGITDITNGHVGAQAVAVSVPEPGTIGFAFVGFAGLLARRRPRA